jgi:NodT family efflux transporter outer membrane factor (OMF) lipoprotein
MFGKLLIVVLITSMMTSCMVGPNFRFPAPPIVKRYTSKPLPKRTVSTPSIGNGGKSQAFRLGEDISGEWWELFHSPVINELIRMGLCHSPTLHAAYAALRVAQENLNVGIGNLMFPAVDAVISGQRQRFVGASFGQTTASIFNVFNATVNVSYTLDVFGGSRRQLEALCAQVNYQWYLLIGAYLTLTSNIVTTAISVASFEAQIKATLELLHAQEYQLRIIRKQFDLGAVALPIVLTQQTLVEQTRSLLPPLRKSLSQSQHALAVLVGTYPSMPIPSIDLDKLVLPKDIPVTFPSEIVKQRPDVLAQIALLHAASAQIGVATANLFPQFNLTGNYGWQAEALSDLFNHTTNIWSIAAQITQPLFHGGALLAQRRASIAAFEQACALYVQTLLQAFQNIADSLRALELDAKALRSQQAAESSAQQSLHLIEQQYHLGGTNYLSLLVAQQQYEQAKIARVRAQANRYTDTAALFQALGGGWWNRASGFCRGKCT